MVVQEGYRRGKYSGGGGGDGGGIVICENLIYSI